MYIHSILVNCEISTLFILTVFVKSTYEQYVIEVWELKAGVFQEILQCDATGADFGGEIPLLSFSVNETGCACFTTPGDSCHDTFNNRTGCANYYAVVPRGNCSFSEKAYHAQQSSPVPYTAMIIYNDEGHSPVPMAGSKYADRVVIPVVMVSHACMTNIMGRFSADKGYLVAIRSLPGYYDLVKYLIPLIAVVSFCFVVLCISLTVRVCRERRHLAKKRLSKRDLKKLPVKKFRKGDAEESCAICIDDFVDGEKLRILPCNHAYHCKCIDPWLTKIRKVCPICKRRVFSSEESDSSDSDNEGRDSTAAPDSVAVYHENAPLLRNAESFSSAGPSASTQTVGPLINMRGRRRPPIRVIVTSPSVSLVPESGTRHLSASDGEIHETASTSSISSRFEAVSGTLRRALRPYYQQIVSRAKCRPWKNVAIEPECASGSSAQIPFVVENNGFVESSETLNIADSFFVGDEHGLEATNIFPSEGVAVNEINCFLASTSGGLTFVASKLEAELFTNSQKNADTSEEVSANQPTVSVSENAEHSLTPVSANLISIVNILKENDLNVGEQSSMGEDGIGSNIQQEHD